MTARSRDAQFASLVATHRERLRGCAWLLTPDPQLTARLCEVALATLYSRWSRVGDPVVAAYRLLVDIDPGRVSTPWRPVERVQLIDELPSHPSRPGLARDLSQLEPALRRIVVLQHVAKLPTGQLAAAIGLPAERVAELTRSARQVLVSQDPRRADDEVLRQQFDQALTAMPPAEASADDAGHGRLLSRRRRLRQGLGAAVAMVAVTLGAMQLSATDPAASLPATDLPAPDPRPVASCDPTQQTCKASLLRDWRAEMATVTTGHLDPRHTYFTGHSYSYDARYDSPTFWTRQGGSLGLDVFRVQRGATQVFVQIATERRFATRCGQTTRQRCVTMRFMDGNRFSLSESTDLRRGLEVQYSPDGTEVITIAARNIAAGRPLSVTRGDLITLAQDERLRLPRL